MSNNESVADHVEESEHVISSDAQDMSQGDNATAEAPTAVDQADDAVKTTGDAIEPDTDSTPKFDSLGLPDAVVEAVNRIGFETPSPIQAATIPVLMSGRDVVGLAQTGTGKTAAFALPVISGIDENSRRPQALVLAPTRELALQVADSFMSFAKHMQGIHVLPIYGGQAYGIQLSGLRRGAQIIVGTPGRIIDHLEKGSLDISELRYVVLDEADEMLQMGFQEDVERILADTPADKQVALFSATMPQAIRRISKQYLNDPEEITVKSKTKTAANIKQRYLQVSHRNKLDALTRILEIEPFEAMIMFVRTKHETEELAEKLRARGFNAAAINGDIAQAQRERTVDQLKDGRLDILVATDVAARGLDVERISHVVNFDIPHDTESYIHRIGRTGRAGRSGDALLFVTPRERRLLNQIERVTNQRLEEMDLPSVEDVNEARKAKFADSITSSLEDDQMEIFRTLVTAYAEEHDVPMVDIAAALATQAQSDEHFFLKERAGERRERDSFRDRDRGDDRGRERGRDRGPRSSEGMRPYRLAVGKRDNVRPGAIVGAIANEGGLNSKDFGQILIRFDHSLVELPENLSDDVLSRLSDTQIAGVNIDIRPDTGPPARGEGGDDRPFRRRERDDRRGGGRFDRDDRRGGGDRGGRGSFRRDDREDRRGGSRDDRRGGGRFDRDDRRGGGRFDRDDRRGGSGERGNRGSFRRDRDGGGRGGWRD